MAGLVVQTFRSAYFGRSKDLRYILSGLVVQTFRSAYGRSKDLRYVLSGLKA